MNSNFTVRTAGILGNRKGESGKGCLGIVVALGLILLLMYLASKGGFDGMFKAFGVK